MAQDVFSTINPSTTSGTQLATILNDFKNALMSGLKGPTRPTQLTAGGFWIDDSQELTPTFIWSFKMYTGSVDVTVFQLNLATGTIVISGSETQFEILKVSADAVGALLKLTKRRVASNGQVLANDDIGVMQFVGRASDSSNPISAIIKAIAMQNMTSSVSSSALVFEGTPTGSATREEWARMVNGRMGVGLVTPEAAFHVRAATGAKIGRLEDGTGGALLTFRKARIASTGATQSGDNIAEVIFNTTEGTTPAEATGAKLEVIATENHTSAALGTKIVAKVCAIGSAALTAVMEIGEEIKSLVLHSFERMKLNSQDVATTASINQLSADKALVRMTGSTATDIRGINSAAGKTKVITIHNASSAIVTIKHANGTATAADRFDLSEGRDISLKAGSSAEFFYDETSSRWKVKSGAGSGGGSNIMNSSLTLTAGGQLAILTNDTVQTWVVRGNAAGGVTMSTTPFGTTPPLTDGSIIHIVGNDDDGITFVPYDSANGILMDGSFTFYNGTTRSFMWVSALSRYVRMGA